MGFTLYDYDNNIIYERQVAKVGVTEHDVFSVSTEIKSIVFHGTDDAFHGSFKVSDSAGSVRLFRCADCLPSSSTTELRNVNIDMNMDCPSFNLPDTANCAGYCRFVAEGTWTLPNNTGFMQYYCSSRIK